MGIYNQSLEYNGNMLGIDWGYTHQSDIWVCLTIVDLAPPEDFKGGHHDETSFFVVPSGKLTVYYRTWP